MADRMTLDVVIQGHDGASGALNNVSRSAVRANQVFKAGADAAKLHADRYEYLYGAMRKVGLALTGFGVGVLGGLFAAAKKAGDMGMALSDMNIRTGVAIETLSKLSYAAAQTGADMGNVEVGLKNVSKLAYAVANGNAEAKKTFDRLGISVTDQNGKLKDAGALFVEVGAAIRQMTTATERSAVASLMFGKNGGMLLGMFTDPKSSLDAYMAKAEKLRLVFGKGAAEGATKFRAKLQDLELQLQMGLITLGLRAMPVMEKLVDWFSKAAEKVAAWADANPKLYEALVAIVIVLAKTAAPLGMFLYMLPQMIVGVVTLAGAYRSLALWMNAANTAWMKNPWMWAALAIILSAIGSYKIVQEEFAKAAAGEQSYGKAAARTFGRNATPLGPAYHGGKTAAGWVKGAMGMGIPAEGTPMPAEGTPMPAPAGWVKGAMGMGMPAEGTPMPAPAGASGGTIKHEVDFNFSGKDIDGDKIANNAKVQRAIKQVAEDVMKGRDMGLRYGPQY